MKILCLGSYLFAPAWRNLGHTVLVLTDYPLPPHTDNRKFDFFGEPSGCEDRLKRVIGEWGPDVLFQADHSTPLVHCGVESIDLPGVWYSIDSHLHHAWHKHYAALFDAVFCAQKNRMALISSYRRHVAWLPLFCQRASDFRPWADRRHDVSFVGSLDTARNPDRVRLFGELRRKAVAEVNVAAGDYVPVYRSSRIVINQSASDDLNLRFFEAMGCGALLITERISHSQEELFEEGADFLAYERGSADDLAAKIDWALNHPAEAEAMARHGHAKTMAGHLEKHRAATVLETLTRVVGGRATRSVLSSDLLAHSAWTHDYCSRLKLPGPLTVFFCGRAETLAGRCGAGLHQPLARLVLAGRALAKGDHAGAMALLGKATPLPDDPEVRLRYYWIEIEALAMAGDLKRASAELEKLRSEFPEREDFLRGAP
jgi:hypothetical protein